MKQTIIHIRHKRTFNDIKYGLKQIEGRLYKGRFKDIFPGQILTLYHDHTTVYIEVTKISIYPTLYEMLADSDIRSKCLPHIDNTCDSIHYYNQFYNTKTINKKLAMAIHFKLCKPL
jgi:ASC-1-like (ASCH) protein